MPYRLSTALIALTLLGTTVTAQEVGITAEMRSLTIQTDAGPVEIIRNQDTEARVADRWTKTSRPCPVFCIQPLVPAEGVKPVAELEVLEALRTGSHLLIDGRVRRQFEAGTIPGAMSVPYTEAADRLDELGCELDFDGFLCDGVETQVILFCNGPWCGQSPTAARRMIAAGFPAENISYYRGGMQAWNGLGLTVVPGFGS